MAEQPWHIKAVHAYTAQGSTPASLWASAVGFQASIKPEPGLSQIIEDQALPCLTCPADADYDPNDIARSQRLAARLLAGWSEPPPTGDTVLALTLGRPGEGYRRNRRLEHLRSGLVDTLRIEGVPHWADWCAGATLAGIDSPEDWQALVSVTSGGHQPDILWISADSLINPDALSQLGELVSNSLFTDGLVLGEGAAAIWLSPPGNSGDKTIARVTWHSQSVPELSKEDPALSTINPHRDGLMAHAQTDPKSQSRWHGWLSRYPDDDIYSEPQHSWLNAGLGYLGSAGWALGIVAALGRLPMPCPPVERMQALHQSLEGRWCLATVDAVKTAEPTPAHSAPQQHPISTAPRQKELEHG